MDKKALLLYIVLFALGWTMSGAYFYYSAPVMFSSAANLDSKQLVTEKTQDEAVLVLQNDIPLEAEADKDIPSPYSRISMGDISVYDNEIVLKIKNPQWAVFTDTNSMDPVIDSTSKAIEIVPNSEEDVHVGDIVAYNSKYVDGVVAHRVVETGYDSSGWYAKLKGDNNPNPDPEKVRMTQIKGIVAAIIY
ncbi:MAG TPA: hypothetical protein VJI97_00540 [Candidatus Nanoarchaeia archaeon]|nr:hypothetical protein [Candidatus Nanoarchaeia archaeon]